MVSRHGGWYDFVEICRQRSGRYAFKTDTAMAGKTNTGHSRPISDSPAGDRSSGAAPWGQLSPLPPVPYIHGTGVYALL